MSDFDAVYREHYSAVRAYIQRKSRSREVADDIAQETFVRAFRAWDRRAPTKPVRNWLMRIAANLFMDLKRAESRRPIELAEGDDLDSRGLERFLDDAESAEEKVMRDFDSARLRAMVETLPEPQRGVVESICLNGDHPAEVAERLGIPLGTVKTRLHRAVKRLAAMKPPKSICTIRTKEKSTVKTRWDGVNTLRKRVVENADALRKVATPKGREVLDLVCEGKALSEIAKRLGISESGVRMRLDALGRHLNSSDVKGELPEEPKEDISAAPLPQPVKAADGVRELLEIATKKRSDLQKELLRLEGRIEAYKEVLAL